MGHPRTPTHGPHRLPVADPARSSRLTPRSSTSPQTTSSPYAAREGATSFDAPGATYTHRDGKCSFETITDEYDSLAATRRSRW